ncbi:MAG: NAD-dependent epimerase/dehydratase family protein [Desulfamplus sp.]|nr:NAD-dependent epimerase/dehydratase family protein [Desulfamplus sp.]
MILKTVLVTGAHGFIGHNLCVRLRQDDSIRLIEVDVDTSPDILETGLQEAEIIFHLAGINRPDKMEEYAVGNVDFTTKICERLQVLARSPHIIFSSSIQAVLNNPYGISKRKAEEELIEFSERINANITIFRMKNVFGKWCRPNYNSVVATFCYNIAHDLPISISDTGRIMELVYVDDVCSAMIDAAGLFRDISVFSPKNAEDVYREVVPSFKITLGELADIIRSFKNFRTSLEIPAFNDAFIHRLYATYLSYLEINDFAYSLDIKTDKRGSLAEFLKSSYCGQIFVSRTKPGITRGNHYHHTKAEKFLVIHGQAIIRFRHLLSNKLIEYPINGEEFRVVDIPPGYTHSIENVGKDELVTIFWADEIFNSKHPDTVFDEVLKPVIKRE